MTTVNVDLIAGDVAANVIPAAAKALIDLRVTIVPMVTGHKVVRQRINKHYSP